MTYKKKLEEAETKSHYQHIATKILRELTLLRNTADTSATVRRRWVWELIQNAKDVHGKAGVKIKIELTHELDGTRLVKFSHNGNTFSADNIRFLIEQVSSKDRKAEIGEKPKTTGKFGTGFLTTHLLSEVVSIDGVAKEPDLEHRKFTLKLDRTGVDLEQITAAVKAAKESVYDLDLRQPFAHYVDGEFNTIFNYKLDDLGLQVAKEGLSDLEKALPYVMMFVEEIESVEILPNRKYLRHRQSQKELGEGFKLAITELHRDGNLSHWPAVIGSYQGTSILVPVNYNGSAITLVNIPESLPRLFCDFPLLGTENFPFPIIVNDPSFNPTDPRDGIFLNTPSRGEEVSKGNKAIITNAVKLYFSLLDLASKKNWKNLHVLADFNSSVPKLDTIDSDWYTKNVLEPIKSKVLNSKIVYTADGHLQQILQDDKNQVYFPIAGKKEFRDRIWCAAYHWFPHGIPRREDIELWYSLRWSNFGRLNTTQFAQFISNEKNVENLRRNLSGIDVFEWLNKFFMLIKDEEDAYDSIINKLAIFPNQNGEFCLLGSLSVDAENIPEIFKDILVALDRDVRKTLLHKNIDNNELVKARFVFQTDLVKLITSEITEKSNNRDISKKYYPGFKMLLGWFINNEEDAKNLFPLLYRDKYLLYDDTEIMTNITKAEQLSNLLSEFNVTDIGQLRAKIQVGAESHPPLLRVTQDILTSMGITNLEEWREALKDKNLEELFAHQSIPTEDMFIYAQSHIARAIDQVKTYLATLNSYDIANAELTAPTTLAGVLKDGKPITVVIRPAYNNEVIIYYGSELTVLEYEHSELWVSDSSAVRCITLGHILRVAKIKKFPI